MAIYPIDKNSPDRVGQLGCDSTSDITDLPAYAKGHGLQPGTTCLVPDGTVQYMLSDGTFIELGSGT